MLPMGVDNKWMSRQAVLTVFGAIITVFVFYNYIAEPIKAYTILDTQVQQNVKVINELQDTIDSIDRLVSIVEDHEEELNNIWPKVISNSTSITEQNGTVNQLITFANSWDRFTAQDWAFLTAKHDSDIHRITEKMTDMQVDIDKILEKLD